MLLYCTTESDYCQNIRNTCIVQLTIEYCQNLHCVVQLIQNIVRFFIKPYNWNRILSESALYCTTETKYCHILCLILCIVDNKNLLVMILCMCVHACKRERCSRQYSVLPVSRVANKLFCKQNKTKKQTKSPPLNTLHEAMHGIHTPKNHFTHTTACQLSLQKLVSY